MWLLPRQLCVSSLFKTISVGFLTGSQPGIKCWFTSILNENLDFVRGERANEATVRDELFDDISCQPPKIEGRSFHGKRYIGQEGIIECCFADDLDSDYTVACLGVNASGASKAYLNYVPMEPGGTPSRTTVNDIGRLYS